MVGDVEVQVELKSTGFFGGHPDFSEHSREIVPESCAGMIDSKEWVVTISTSELHQLHRVHLSIAAHSQMVRVGKELLE